MIWMSLKRHNLLDHLISPPLCWWVRFAHRFKFMFSFLYDICRIRLVFFIDSPSIASLELYMGLKSMTCSEVPVFFSYSQLLLFIGHHLLRSVVCNSKWYTDLSRHQSTTQTFFQFPILSMHFDFRLPIFAALALQLFSIYFFSYIAPLDGTWHCTTIYMCFILGVPSVTGQVGSLLIECYHYVIFKVYFLVFHQWFNFLIF